LSTGILQIYNKRNLITTAVPHACDVTLSRHWRFICCSCTQLCMEVIGVRTNEDATVMQRHKIHYHRNVAYNINHLQQKTTEHLTLLCCVEPLQQNTNFLQVFGARFHFQLLYCNVFLFYCTCVKLPTQMGANSNTSSFLLLETGCQQIRNGSPTTTSNGLFSAWNGFKGDGPLDKILNWKQGEKMEKKQPSVRIKVWLSWCNGM